MWQGFGELAAIGGAAALLVALGAELLAATIEIGDAWVLPAGLVLGILLADFGTGAVHWFCDSFFSEDTPVLGRTLIAPFRAHHVDPRGIVRHGWLELHSNSCIPVVAILAAARVLSPDTAAGRWLLADSCLFFAALTGAMTNQAPSSPTWSDIVLAWLPPSRRTQRDSRRLHSSQRIATSAGSTW